MPAEKLTDLSMLPAMLRPHGLMLSGLCHSQADEPCGSGTVALLSPAEDFWSVFSSAPEHRDGQPHPLDRWSERVVGDLAKGQQATALFPFGGPPYLPFMRWALRSGEAFPSPIHFLVHRRAGLWLSWRGALFWPQRLALPAADYSRPCDGCLSTPCLSACPVSAFTPQGYDAAACHDWLEREDQAQPRPQQGCMATGCAARRACPVSQSFARPDAQSAFHMRAFHTAPPRS